MAYPKITAASSVGSFRDPDQLVGHTGLFPSSPSRRNVDLPQFPGDYFEDTANREVGESNTCPPKPLMPRGPLNLNSGRQDVG